MRKYIINVIVSIFLSFSIMASEKVIRKSEKILLSKNKTFYKKYKFENNVILNCKYEVRKFFENTVIYAESTIENKSKNNLYIAYYVAFFDKENNLIGAAGQYSLNGPIKTGEEFVTNTCIIPLPLIEIKKIKYFKLTLILSEKIIGK